MWCKFTLNKLSMINSFIVKAIPDANLLKIVLDGVFMKSEVELALLLVRNESKKLKKGFKVVADLANFKSKSPGFNSGYYKIQQVLRSISYNEINFVGQSVFTSYN
jgi:hypothetical protein